MFGLFVLGATLLAVQAGGSDPSPAFTRKPTAVRQGDKVRIEFAVDRLTDVAVFVEDEKGKRVRHLVAGVLGPNPPEPLAPNSLAQSIDWDLKDDEGKDASGAGLKVRVALGLRPALEEYLFDTPGALRGGPASLAVDKDGNVYHSTNPGGVYSWNAPGMLVRVYDRRGKYLRTILPYPANLPADKVKAWGAFEAEGHLYPVFHDIMSMRTVPGREGTQGACEMFVTSQGRLYKLLGPTHWALRPMNVDGSAPADVPVTGPSFFTNLPMSPHDPRPFIGVSSDEKWAYMSGVATKGGKDGNQWLHAVYRAPLDGSRPGEIFLGFPNESGADDKHFNHPTGVCSDGHGLLYVSDGGNDRVQVFREADGGLVGTIPVTAPSSIQVHPKTGALYVAASGGRALVKISGRSNPREMARLALNYPVPNFRYPPIVLDASSEPPVLYSSGPARALDRIEDKGTSFELRRMDSAAPGCGNAEDLSVDRKREELYFKPGAESFVRVDLKTGKLTPLPYKYMGGTAGTQLAVAPDGTYYTLAVAGKFYLRKWDRDFKPLNFAALGKPVLELSNFMSFAARGLTVAPNGDLYVMPVDRDGNPGWGRTTEVQVYGPDGTKKGTVLWRCSESATGPRVDRRGNVYIAENFKAPGRAVPDFFKGRLPDYTEKVWRGRWSWSNPVGQAAWAYGGLLKFPPSGGAVWYNPGRGYPGGKSGLGQDVPAEVLQAPRTTLSAITSNGHLRNIEVQGALWSYFGYSAITDKLGGGYDCNCQATRFDVDDFGRVFFPDTLRFRVGVLDTNGTEFCSVGTYGNRDAGGPRVAFAYPYTVAVSHTHLFVGDLLNNRIAKVRLAYAAEGSCGVP